MYIIGFSTDQHSQTSLESRSTEYTQAARLVWEFTTCVYNVFEPKQFRVLEQSETLVLSLGVKS